MICFDVEPERGATERYWMLESAMAVADELEVAGQGPVPIWRVSGGRKVRLR